MKSVSMVVSLCLLAVSFAITQDQKPTPNTPPDPNANAALLKEFTRSSHIEGLTLSFVLLNDRTVDVLFEAPGKYAMRARARMATTFFVQGTPEKDIQLETKFVVEQNGEKIAGTSHNIKNFADGAVAKGTRIDGIIEMSKKLDLTHSFKIKGGHSDVDFKLTPEAVKLAEPLAPPAPPAAIRQNP
ncbi:MAG TPA: hypothetical protein VE398_24715 [Acidobacteriota bacterium]|nr:hypothetical protein [Acidobacteriota bacterium]